MSSYPRSWTCATCASPYFSFALQVLLAGTFFAEMRETIFNSTQEEKGIQFVIRHWVFWVQKILNEEVSSI